MARGNKGTRKEEYDFRAARHSVFSMYEVYFFSLMQV